MNAIDKLDELKTVSGLSWDKLAILLGYHGRGSLLKSKERGRISSNAEKAIELWICYLKGDDMNKKYEEKIKKLNFPLD